MCPYRELGSTEGNKQDPCLSDTTMYGQFLFRTSPYGTGTSLYKYIITFRMAAVSMNIVNLESENWISLDSYCVSWVNSGQVDFV